MTNTRPTVFREDQPEDPETTPGMMCGGGGGPADAGHDCSANAGKLRAGSAHDGMSRDVAPVPVVLLLFNRTPNMGLPWLDAGYEVWSVDMQPGPDMPGWTHQQADMMTWIPPRSIVERVAFVAAFRPCTDVAVSGARWFPSKGLGALRDAVALFEKAQFWCDWFGKPYMLENPVSTMSTYWRKPDHLFHPHDYAGLFETDNYTKKTCLWTGNGFVMPDPCPGQLAPDDRIHRAAPGPDRADFRSVTPMGFSRATFQANGRAA